MNVKIVPNDIGGKRVSNRHLHYILNCLIYVSWQGTFGRIR